MGSCSFERVTSVRSYWR